MSENKEESKLKGFSLFVDETGKIELEPVNLNDLEFIGLLDYANQKKQEMLQVISNAPEHRTLAAIGQLSGVLKEVFQTAQKQVEASSES